MANIFIEFKQILRDYGLEYFNRYYGSYKGTVYDNQDPEFRGRLRVLCPKVYGKDSPNYWALSKGMPSGKAMGLYHIPSNNDPLWISFEGGDVRFPIWEYGWFPANASPATARRTPPDNYVWQSPKGQRIEIDDKNELIRITNKAGFEININKNGINFGNGEDNLFKFLDDLMQLFSTTTTMTAIGSQPFMNVADYAQLRLKLKNFLDTTA